MKIGNSFTFLRLFFALAVVIGHSYALGGFGDDPLKRGTTGQVEVGSLAVLCFFVVSGYLITGSVIRQPSLWRFGLNRCARILPGFWGVQLLTVFVLAPAITLHRYGSQLGYWDSILVGPNSAFSYLCRNAGFRILQYPITNLFLHNPSGAAVNGSLWSLAPEVVCYVCLAVLALVRGLRWKFTGPLLFVVVYVLHAISYSQPQVGNAVADVLQNIWIMGFHLPGHRSLFLAFLAGLSLYQWRDSLRWQPWLAAAASASLVGSCWANAYYFVWPFTLPYLVLYLAHRLPFQRVEKAGDFSYGIYIYAFPMQQCLALAGFHRRGLPLFTAASLVLALAAGFVSWRCFEKPVLDWVKARGRKNQTELRDQEATVLNPTGRPAEALVSI